MKRRYQSLDEQLQAWWLQKRADVSIARYIHRQRTCAACGCRHALEVCLRWRGTVYATGMIVCPACEATTGTPVAAPEVSA